MSEQCNYMEKSKRGGKRPGAGRPVGTEKTVLQFRVPAKYAGWLKEEVKKAIGNLIKNME